MSIRLTNLAWDIPFHGKPAKKLVLLLLADMINNNGETAWPSYDKMAKKCSLSKRAVIGAVKELEADGYLTRTARYKAGGLRTSNSFCLNEQFMAKMAANLDAGGEPDSPLMVNTFHHNSEQVAPLMVNTFHLDGEQIAPKPELNQNINQNENHAPSSSLEILAGHFEQHLGYPAPHESSTMFQDKWQPVLSAILEFTGGDVERAKAIIDASVDFARGKGPGSNGKTFTLASPFSIRNIWHNRVAELDAANSAADEVMLWQQAVAAVTSGNYSDDRLRNAIRAIGGSGRIKDAAGRDVENLRRSLANEYRTVATV